MRHYIEVCWQGRRTLVNLTRLVTVVDAPHGCKIHMQGYCLEVADSYEEVLGRIEAAEAERVFDPKRKLAFRFGEEEPGESSSIAAAAAMRSIPQSSDDGGGVTPNARTPAEAAAHERRRDPPGVPAGEEPGEADQDPGG